jgi:arginine:ornithine antiporter/lysine permease
MYAAAKDGVMPRFLAKVNAKGTPVNALLFTQGFTQLFLLAILSPKMNNTYLAAITIATTLVLIPYLLSSLYAVKISIINRKIESPIHFTIALLGTIYAIYVIYAVGLKYLFFSIIFYGIGSLLFLKAKREKNEQPKRWEWVVMGVLICMALVILVLIMSGKIEL